jgi:O-antigen ligase
LEIWQASAKSILQKPLLGVGLGNYFEVLNEDASTAKKGSSAHHLYLDFASEVGILGAVIIILMFCSILYSSWLVFQHAREEHFKLFGLLFCLYFLWIAAYSFFDVVLLNDKVFLFFMVLAATLYNIRNLEMEPQKMEKPAPYIIKNLLK